MPVQLTTELRPGSTVRPWIAKAQHEWNNTLKKNPGEFYRWVAWLIRSGKTDEYMDSLLEENLGEFCRFVHATIAQYLQGRSPEQPIMGARPLP